MMPDDYQIPDDPDTGRRDADYLRTCFDLSELDEPPPQLWDAVRRAHYDISRPLSLLGGMGPGGMDRTQLAIVVALAKRELGVELPPEEPPQHPPRMYTVEGRVVSGQKVVVHWQMKDQPAHFIEKEGDRVKLLVKGNEVRFRPDLVRCAEEGEFPDVPDNINQPVGA